MIFFPRVNTFDFGTAKRRRVSLSIGIQMRLPWFFPMVCRWCCKQKKPIFPELSQLKALIEKGLQPLGFICKPFMFFLKTTTRFKPVNSGIGNRCFISFIPWEPLNFLYLHNFDELVKSLILLDVAHKRLFTKPSILITWKQDLGLQFANRVCTTFAKLSDLCNS